MPDEDDPNLTPFEALGHHGPKDRDRLFWPGKTLSIRLHGVLEDLDKAALEDFWFEISGRAAAELAQLIREAMDAAR